MEKRKRLASCICGKLVTIAPGQTKEFETETNQTCPAHGVRRVTIFPARIAVPDNYPESEKERIRKRNAEVDEALERYHARVAAAEANSSSSDR
jgi:hypothetical protein